MTDRAHLARLQRRRRARMIRIDYMPSAETLTVIAARRAEERPGSVAATNSAVINAIVTEWAVITGINKLAKFKANQPDASGINAHFAHARAPAYESERAPGIKRPFRAPARMSSARPLRVICGAKRHRDGQPCQAKSEPGKRRCRFHGGRSTGPRTDSGRARALANLRQYAKLNASRAQTD